MRPEHFYNESLDRSLELEEQEVADINLLDEIAEDQNWET